MDLAVRVRRGRAGAAVIALEGVEDRHLCVGDGIGVVVAIDLLDEGLSPVEVEPLDLIERALDEIDRLGMERRRSARKTGFERLDFDGRKAFVKEIDCDYYTDAIEVE